MSGPRLAIDLSSKTVRVLEGALGGPMRCGESGTPEGAIDRGRILDAAAVGSVLRQILARAEITATRALVAANDNIASFRVLSFPAGTTDADVDAALKRELPGAIDRLAVQRKDLVANGSERTVFATAWDREQVRTIGDAVRRAGLEPAVVDLRSHCVARAVGVPSCVVLDMSAEPLEAVLVDGGVPRAWHSFMLGADGDLAGALAAGLRPVLAYYRGSNGSAFSPDAPVLVRSDQMMPAAAASRLEQLCGHPVEPVPQPARLDHEVRFGPYLACVGLVMRRSA